MVLSFEREKNLWLVTINWGLCTRNISACPRNWTVFINIFLPLIRRTVQLPLTDIIWPGCPGGKQTNVSGYVCNHGSPSGERDTASPRGRYGERPQRDSVWRYICKNTTCWPATAHDVTTGVPQYKCRREDTSSASSSEACVRSMAQSPGDAVSRSPLGEPWLHT